jgi:GT2 family glycosyltransferase
MSFSDENHRSDYRFPREEVKGDRAGQPLVYVVILNWNLKEDTAECIASLLCSRYPSCDILVVDNASTDGSIDFLRSRFPQIWILGNKTNLGYAGGTNRGIQYAMDRGAAYILLLNNDTVVADDMIQTLVAAVEADPTIGVAGPAVLYYGSPDRLWYLGHKESRWLPVPRPLRPNSSTGPLEVDYLSGCGMLVRRTLFRTVGLLDERYFMYYEDADFCRRARKVGYRIVAVPEARMWHKVSRSASKDPSGIAYIRTRNRIAFYRRHPHGPSPLLTALYLAGSVTLAALRALIQGQDRVARSLVRGCCDGYRSGVEELSSLVSEC